MSEIPSGQSDQGLQPVHSVLVAEDEHLVAETLRADLEQMGFAVMGPVANGQAAIELASQERPDIALLDIRMPGVDGITAASSLFKEMDIPVVILSAYSEQQDLEQLQEAGVFGYLLKPVSSDALRVTLNVAWSRYQEVKRLNGQVQDLEGRLASRKIIERAKGIIQETLGVNEAEAMKRLQKQSRDARKPMVELAKALLDSHGLLDQK